jgi:hypothetical protein
MVVMKYNFEVIGELKPVKYGLVDFVADGVVVRGSDTVPCKVGFQDHNGVVKPEYLFTDNTFVGDVFYHAETIKL